MESFGLFVHIANSYFLKTIGIYLFIGLIIGFIIDILMLALKLLCPDKYYAMLSEDFKNSTIFAVFAGVIITSLVIWPALIIELIRKDR